MYIYSNPWNHISNIYPRTGKVNQFQKLSRIFIEYILRPLQDRTSKIERVIPRERHVDSALKSGQIEFLVPKDAQCSETYAKTIFLYFYNFFV